MDVLHLFPNENGRTGQQLIFGAFREQALLCHSRAEPNILSLTVASTSAGEQSSSAAGCSSKGVLFKRISNILLEPALPRNADFHHLLVNENGSRVALVGTKMIFIVEMDADFWSYQSALEPHSLAHIRPEYYAKCDLLHMSLFLRKFSPSVLTMRWLGPHHKNILETENRLLPVNDLLGVLFSDNVIRLYDVSTTPDSPIVQLDFNALLPDQSPAESDSESAATMSTTYSSKLGFFTKLVSFDFGPPFITDGIELSQKGGPTRAMLGSVLALDSNGQLYAGMFALDGASSLAAPPLFQVQCHFPASSPVQSRLLCSASHLLHLRHSLSSHISVWALAAEDGLLVHLALSWGDQKPRSADTNYISLNVLSALASAADSSTASPLDLFVLECVEVAGAAKPLQLQNEPGKRAVYLIAFGREVYRVELDAVVRHIWAQCSGRLQTVPLHPPQSGVHQLLLFTGPATRGSSISALACLEVSSGAESSLKGNDQTGEEHLLLTAALCSNAFGEDTKERNAAPKSLFLATLLGKEPSREHQTGLSSRSQPVAGPQNAAQAPLLGDQVRALLVQRRAQAQQLPQSLPAAISLPTVGENELEELQQRSTQLALVQRAVEEVLVRGQLPIRQIGIEFAIERASSLLGSLRSVEQFRHTARQRLTTLFSQIIELKAQVQQHRQQFSKLQERIRKVSHSLQPLMFPAAGAEQTAITKLCQMQARLRECVNELVKLDQRMRDHRRSLCSAPSRPLAFIAAPCAIHASHPPVQQRLMPAQMFILSKNSRECAKLRELVESMVDGHKSGTTER